MASIVLLDEFQSAGTVQVVPEVRKIVFVVPPATAAPVVAPAADEGAEILFAASKALTV